MTPSLSVSVVTWFPNFGQLEALLRSIEVAVASAQSEGVLAGCSTAIVDNSADTDICNRLKTDIETGDMAEEIGLSVDCADRNLGYGNAHNRAIAKTSADFHLILNPDVLLAPDALSEALRYMQGHPEVGLLGPRGTDERGRPLHLCKRYPTVFDLFLRGFAPSWLRHRFSRHLEHYEMRDLDADKPMTGVPIVSGCFMLARAELLKELRGFDPRFFLYFEDFDLSLRMGRIAEVACVPSVRIQHFGGQAARKGPGHVGMFVRSAVKFFRLHGWRWW